MTERKPDELPDDYLRGDSPLTRAYRETGREEPPSRLDAAVLARVKAESAPRRGGRPRWLMPLSLAATVALAVGLTLFMAREGGTPPLPPEIAPVDEPAPKVVPKQVPRFEPRVFTPKETPTEKTPAQWLAEIEELRRDGKYAEADEQLAEFRRRYPGYPIKR